MRGKTLIIAILLLGLILTAGFFVVQSSNQPYALMMQNCGGSGQVALAGTHITWHSTIDEAKQAGDRRLAEYNQAAIYMPPNASTFNPLLWLKTTNAACYNGQYMQWTAIDQ
jgi:hypothetical protein